MILNIYIDILKDIKMESSQKSNLIWLNDKIAIKMRNPTIDILNLMNKKDDSLADVIISKCVEQIIEDEEVHDADSVNENELIEFVSQLQTKDYQKMWEFIENSPKLKYENVHECPRCGFKHTIKLEGLSDFFS
jgi:hypothetical protein